MKTRRGSERGEGAPAMPNEGCLGTQREAGQNTMGEDGDDRRAQARKGALEGREEARRAGGRGAHASGDSGGATTRGRGGPGRVRCRPVLVRDGGRRTATIVGVRRWEGALEGRGEARRAGGRGAHASGNGGGATTRDRGGPGRVRCRPALVRDGGRGRRRSSGARRWEGALEGREGLERGGPEAEAHTRAETVTPVAWGEEG